MSPEDEHGTWWRIFDGIRRVTVFLLGAAVISAALYDPESANTISMLLIGMVMVGILPIENVLPWRRRKERE